MTTNTVTSERGHEYLSASVDLTNLNIDGYRLEAVPVATDTPITRSFGEERLVVTKQAITNWQSLVDNGMPLLEFHKSNTRALGRVENPQISGGVLYMDCVFDKRNPLAVDYYTTIKEKMKMDLSISLLKDRFEADRLGQTMAQSQTVLKWSPYDVCVLGHGSDPNCGFRAAVDAEPQSKEESGVTIGKDIVINSKEMTKETAKTVDSKPANEAVKQESNSVNSERAFVNSVYKFANKYGIDNTTAAGWIDEGIDMAEIKSRTLEAVSERAAADAAPVNFVPATKIRFTDVKTPEPQGNAKYNDGNTLYSMRGALDALRVMRSGQRNFDSAAGLALDVSKELGGGDGVLRVPYSVMSERAFEYSAAAQGVPITPEVVRNDKWVDYLHQSTVAGAAGIQMETGWTANSTVPVELTTIEAYHVGENEAATESTMTTSNVPVRPHQVVALTKETNLARAVLPGIQARLQRQMNTQLKVAIDRCSLLGGGPNEPTGIMATAGVTDTKNPKEFLSLDGIRDLATEIENANVTDQLSIVTTPDVVNYWRKLKASSSNNLPVWTDNADRIGVDKQPGYIDGMPVYKSTNLKQFLPGANAATRNAELAKQNRVIIGAFNQAIIGFFGEGMDLEVGTDGVDFSNNRISIRLVAYYDTKPLRPAAFKALEGIKIK